MVVGQAIRRSQSCDADPRRAAEAVCAELEQPELALVLLFCSSRYDLDVLAFELRRLFAGVEVIGCTTAGEIGTLGCRQHSLSGVSFSATHFAAATGRIDHLDHFEAEAGEALARHLRGTLEPRGLARGAPRPSLDNLFGLQLVDGLSLREEAVSRAFQHGLGRVPLLGGSAADDLDFERTSVLHDGRFHRDAAVLALLSTALPLYPMMTQHFVATGQRVVVTEADAARRVVKELDGRPAAQCYAELVGVDPADLDPMRFAASPMVVVIGGTAYVRSISRALPDGSLTFFCAIDEGMVLRVARAADLKENLERAFAAMRAAIGEPSVVIAADCALRRLEMTQRHLAEPMGALFVSHRVVGFNGYGEQYLGMHVNQTFTAIAVGGAGAATDG